MAALHFEGVVMQLLLIRHARAASNHGEPDVERPLTDDGRREFERVAREIIRSGTRPALILHSPARRTNQTAEILAAETGPTVVQQIASWLAIGTDYEKILPKLAELSADVVALVGHEPIMSSLTALLMGSGRLSFSPGTSACLEFDKLIQQGAGRLLWLLEP